METLTSDILKRTLGVVSILLTACVSLFGQSLELGSPAPDFALRYATRDSIASARLHLSSIVGTNALLLAFYPADWSGGCTKEVCGFRDDIASLEELGIEVLAISGDYVYSHHEWAKHHNLPFRLLSDHDHAVARAYQSYNESSGYNKRTVFVVDRSGHLAYIDLEYSVRDNVDFEALVGALKKIRSQE